MSAVSQTAAEAPAVSACASGVPAIDSLAFSIVAALHRHPHLSNVLTHISRASWPRIEHTLGIILDPATQRRDLTPLARNMLDLMVAERGDTGRIFKPYFRALLVAAVGPNDWPVRTGPRRCCPGFTASPRWKPLSSSRCRQQPQRRERP